MPPIPAQSDPGTSDGLNPAQRRAAEFDGGPLIVLAGPGTGKTRVIVARIERLLRDGAEPESILALSFSRKAAAHMRDKAAERVGARTAERLNASTFHAFGSTMLARFGDLLGLRRQRTLMDSAQTRRLLRRLVREHDLFRHHQARGRDGVLDDAGAFISLCRQWARTPADALAHADRWTRSLADTDLAADERAAQRSRLNDFRDRARLYDLFARACIDEGLVTYDDFLALPLRLLSEHPAPGAILRSEIRHILVDEYQDVNRAQIELLKHLAPPAAGGGSSPGPDLCVVGDDDQAIYAFRGSDPGAFNEFRAVWPHAAVVALTDNYRNSRAVAAVAGAIIARCDQRVEPDKVINPVGEDGLGAPEGAVEGVILAGDREAGVVVASLVRLIRRDDPERGPSIGVLAGANSHAQSVAAALERAEIPASLLARRTPLDDPAVQDLLAWISVLTAPVLDPPVTAVERLLARPPFSVPAEDAARWAQSFRRERSLAEDAQPPSFIDWLRAAHTDDPSVARFLSLLDDFRALAGHAPADRVIDAIVRDAELVHAEILDPRGRADRIATLVQVLRFVRSRQPFLDPPGGLHAWTAYYHDLHSDERQFALRSSEDLDEPSDDDAPAAPGSPVGPSVVQVLTAHAAKGLEFDVVILVRCRSGGFPPKRRADHRGDLAPDEFLAAPRADQDEEHRRIFYVACTRARRRLVLLAKAKAKTKLRPGDASDYFNELTLGDPPLVRVVHQGADLIDRAGLTPDDDRPLDDDAPVERASSARLIDDEAARVRRSVYAALHDASDPRAHADPPARVAIHERLAHAADALSALALLRAGADLPADLPEPFAARLRAVRDAARSAASPVPFTHPVPGPLDLSYSSVELYGRCPRCWYARHVLKLEEPRSEALEAGTVLHAALEEFFNTWRRADAEGRALPGADSLEAIVRRVCREQCPPAQPLDPESVRTAVAQARHALESLHDPADNILHIEQRIAFPWPDPDGLPAHRFTAKVDRIDQRPDGSFRIIDYKTGHAGKDLLNPGPDDLQLALYAIALDALLRSDPREPAPIPAESPHAGAAEYWLLATAQRGQIDLKRLDLLKAAKTVDRAIRGIRSGEFPRGKQNECRGLCHPLPDDR